MSELHNNNERDVELYRGWDLMRKVRSCLVWVNVVYFYWVFHLDLNTDGRLHEHYLDDYKHDVPLLQTGSLGIFKVWMLSYSPSSMWLTLSTFHETYTQYN